MDLPRTALGAPEREQRSGCATGWQEHLRDSSLGNMLFLRSRLELLSLCPATQSACRCQPTDCDCQLSARKNLLSHSPSNPRSCRRGRRRNTNPCTCRSLLAARQVDFRMLQCDSPISEFSSLSCIICESSVFGPINTPLIRRIQSPQSQPLASIKLYHRGFLCGSA